MDEKPLRAKWTEKLIFRVVIWPSFETPTMSRFGKSKGTVIAFTKKFHFPSRKSLPDVLTSQIWQEADKPLLAKRLRLLQDSYPKAKLGLEEDGTAILVEILEPGKRYRAYYFHDTQDPKLYRDTLEVTKPRARP